MNTILKTIHNPFRILLKYEKLNDTSVFRHFSTTTKVQNFKQTVYHDFHVSQGGKMVEFAGYSMPVQYGKVGIAASHNHVRNHCGIFDVSHMLQFKVHGKDNIKYMESMIVADILGLKPNTGTLSLFTNKNGGIIDDLICSKTEHGYLYVVSNAGCRDKDLAHMNEKLKDFVPSGHDVALEIIEDHALLAVQGPQASQVVKPLTDKNVDELYFMNTAEVKLAGVDCRITRCGYTGEDGFEISIPQNKAVEVCETLLGSIEGDVQLSGLGARDSLRLEAGLCLYGNDIDDSTTPVQAGLAWTIGKRRRSTADFTGANVILKELKQKPNTKRVGLISKGPPPRTNSIILDEEGVEIGKVTSGVPSPTLGVNVAMGYVQTNLAKNGTQLSVEVRKKRFPAVVSKMPFVPCKYYMPKK